MKGEPRKSLLSENLSFSKGAIDKSKLQDFAKWLSDSNKNKPRRHFDFDSIAMPDYSLEEVKSNQQKLQFWDEDNTKTGEDHKNSFNCLEREDVLNPQKRHQSKKMVPKQKFSDARWDELTRSGNREQNIDSLVKIIKNRLRLICVSSKRLYVFGGKIYEDISDRKLAAACFKEVLAEKTNRLFKDYSEIHNQLLSDPEIAVTSLDEVPTNRDVVVFPNGTFNVREKHFYENQFWEEDYIFSMLAIEYDETDVSGKKVIDNFLNTFCAGLEERKRLFCEILGFCLSNYENKKACFYFLGAPDAGKSTVCRFIEQVIGENLYMACSIKELNSKYATGELVGIKVCADEDVATNKPLKSEDIALIKKITSSDKIRTRQIYQSAVQLRPDCKLVWAGNGMLTFATSEDLQPLINRLIIFPLDVSIPKEERDPDILAKLLVGRNYMITLALEALHDLVENRFNFSEVVDTEDYFNPQIYLNGIEEFVESECQLESDAVAYTQELYFRYQQFCKRNFEYKALSTNQFIPYLKNKYGVEKYSSGSKRGIRGIRLLDIVSNDIGMDEGY